MKKKFTYKDISIGQTFRLGNERFKNWGYSKGEQVIITYKSGSSLNIQDTGGNKQQIAVLIGDLEPGVYTKDEILKEVASLESEIKEKKAMIEWMQETDSEEYDETEFKVWNTLKTLDSNSSMMEKTKVIARLIKG